MVQPWKNKKKKSTGPPPPPPPLPLNIIFPFVDLSTHNLFFLRRGIQMQLPVLLLAVFPLTAHQAKMQDNEQEQQHNV